MFAVAAPPARDRNPHISKALRELSAIYSILSDEYRAYTLSKAAIAVSMYPHKIRTREDALSIKRLPGGGKKRSTKEGSTVDKVIVKDHSCLFLVTQTSANELRIVVVVAAQIVELATTGRLERLETLKKDPKIGAILTFGKVQYEQCGWAAGLLCPADHRWACATCADLGCGTCEGQQAVCGGISFHRGACVRLVPLQTPVSYRFVVVLHRRTCAVGAWTD